MSFLAPDNLKTTSQTLLASTNSIAGVLGSSRGALITLLGIKQFYLVIGLSMLVILVLYLLSFPLGKRFWHKAPRFESLLSRI